VDGVSGVALKLCSKNRRGQMNPASKQQTLDKIGEYLEWWKTQPTSLCKRNAMSELQHTRRRIQEGWPEPVETGEVKP